MARWHLDFENRELRERVESWTIDVLRDWGRKADRCEALRVDCGFWEYLKDPRRRLSSDRPPVPFGLERWNSDREEFGDYATRTRERVERLLQEQRRTEDKRLEQHSAKTKPGRKRGHDPALNFEFVARYVCLEKWSDGKIANHYGLPRERVKKARERLMADLRMGT